MEYTTQFMGCRRLHPWNGCDLFDQLGFEEECESEDYPEDESDVHSLGATQSFHIDNFGRYAAIYFRRDGVTAILLLAYSAATHKYLSPKVEMATRSVYAIG